MIALGPLEKYPRLDQKIYLSWRQGPFQQPCFERVDKHFDAPEARTGFYLIVFSQGSSPIGSQAQSLLAIEVKRLCAALCDPNTVTEQHMGRTKDGWKVGVRPRQAAGLRWQVCDGYYDVAKTGDFGILSTSEP
jgi:hypothetical protein